MARQTMQGHCDCKQKDVTMDYEQAGLDSLASVELQNTLSKLYGRELPATVIMDHPTVSALAAFLQTGTHAAKFALPTVVQLTQVAHHEGGLSYTKLFGAAGRFPQASGKSIDLYVLC
jgi:candicidin polyketide synthase FscB